VHLLRLARSVFFEGFRGGPRDLLISRLCGAVAAVAARADVTLVDMRKVRRCVCVYIVQQHVFASVACASISCARRNSRSLTTP
jgi:hypothetical protein